MVGTRRVGHGAVGVVLTALVAAGCGGAGNRPATVVQARPVGSLGRVLADAHGKTLYLFVPDARRRVACTGTCPGTWPPLLLTRGGAPAAGSGVNRDLLGAIRSPDGGRQATYNGWPLYTYVGDLSPGEANGNGLDLDGGLWYSITPAGVRAGAR
jgi:predicted lipoprotein with Yx(FWY)xxD motif